MNATKVLYTVKETADLLGLSRATVFRMVKSGKIRATRIGRNYVIPVEDIPHYLLGGLTEEKKTFIRNAITKALEEYGETFRRLASE